MDYDLIVIGAGSGGVRASRIAAGHGARVAVIEEDRPGGTCVLRGCVPKKLLVYGSAFASEFQDSVGFGWDLAKPPHDWQAMIRAKDSELDRLASAYIGLLGNAGVTLIKGRGRITGANSVNVGGVGAAGKTYTAERILIAVGGWPYCPDIDGLRDHALNSNDVLDLDHRPDSIAILGSGYIAVEFAGIFNSLGSDVHLIYRTDWPMRGFDDDVRASFAQSLKYRGITLHSGRTITSVSAGGSAGENGKKALLDNGQILNVDAVIAATGRRPMTDDLGLDSVGVETNKNGAIIVDGDCTTNVPSIFAIGDVTDRINLTPVALAEGHAFADTFYGGKPRRVDYSNIASAVFSQPPIASVGFSEEAAKDAGHNVEIFTSSFRTMKSMVSGRCEESFLKLVVDKASDVVLGAHMVGDDSPEIVQGLAIAIKAGAKKSDFDATIGIHPTTAEEFVTMRVPRS